MQVAYPVLPIGLIGAGALGDELLRLCCETGLPTEYISRTTSATTSQTHVMNVPGDSRTFFHHPGANRLLDDGAIDLGEMARQGIKIFYLGYLTLLDGFDQILPEGRTRAAKVLSEARTEGLITCVDLSSTPSDRYRETVEHTLSAIDFLFANEWEAEQATGMSLGDGTDEDAMIRACHALTSGGVNRAVILHSPSLVVWCWDGAEGVFAPPRVPPERVVSAVGAGDAFAAGVIHGIHEGWPPGSCIGLGARAAAACLSGFTATDGLRGLSTQVPDR